MGRFNYKTLNKRERLVESLSLGFRRCGECDTVSLTLDDLSNTKVSCTHCKGEWLVNDDKSLTRQTFDNVKPLYLEEGG